MRETDGIILAMIEQLALLRILALGRLLLCAGQDSGAWREVRWTAFDQDVRVLVMAHWDGIGVGVVEFLMGSRTRVWRNGYLQPTRELVWVCVLEVRGDGTWCGCRVWSSGGNGCGGGNWGDGALGSIPGLCRAGNGIEGSETGEVGVGNVHIMRWKR